MNKLDILAKTKVKKTHILTFLCCIAFMFFACKETSPTITLNGAKELELPLGEIFIDPGVAVQNKKGDIINVVSTNNNINKNLVETYTLNYVAKNSAGLEATTSRIVKL
jgi:hypothetical protein